MSQEVLFFTENFEEAKNEIEESGGRVTQVFTDSVFTASVPDDFNFDSLKHSTTEPPKNLDTVSQLSADAWLASLSKAEAAPSALEGVSWDAEGRTPPLAVENDEELARLSEEEKKNSLSGAPENLSDEASEAPAKTTSDYLIGSVAVGIVMVSGTAPGLALSAAEKTKIIAEVQEGLGFLATVEPAAGVTFVYDIQDVTVSAAPNPNCNSYEGCESIWRTPALQQMGVAGVSDYIANIQASKGTDWAYAVFFTKYKLNHFAYAYTNYLCMEYSNDGWGPDQINKVLAHETCHVFGASDEYASSGCSCAPAGYLQVPNNNCENCPGTHVACLMTANTLSMCEWSKGQIGWDSRLLHKYAAPLGACSWGENRIDVFGLDPNQEVLQLWWSDAWNWSRLGSEFSNTRFAKQLTSCSWGDGRIDVFGLDAAGKVLQLWWDGSWHWSNLGNNFQNTRFSDQIAACSWGNNRIDIFGIDSTGKVLQLWWNGAWHWTNLGNGFQNTRFSKDLAACSWGENRIDIFGIDSTGKVLQLWWDGAWHWQNLGSNFQNTRFAGQITACSWGENRIDIFGLDSGGNVLQLWWNGAWHWTNLGNGFQNTRFAGELTACSWGDGRIDIFGLDANGKVLQLWWNGAWHWNSVG